MQPLSGLFELTDAIPRVATKDSGASQPWAEGRNPFGIWPPQMWTGSDEAKLCTDFLPEGHSFSPQMGRRSIAGGRCCAGMAQSSLRQGFLHAQLVMNNCSESFYSFSWVRRAPDIPADGRAARAGGDHFGHQFQSALQALASRPARRHNRDGAGGNNLSKGFDITGEGHFDYVGSAFDPAAHRP